VQRVTKIMLAEVSDTTLGRLVPFHSDTTATGGDIRALPLPYKMVVT
jgi:hypothetical protein